MVAVSSLYVYLWETGMLTSETEAGRWSRTVLRVTSILYLYLYLAGAVPILILAVPGACASR